jgi:hypothetical protein
LDWFSSITFSITGPAETMNFSKFKASFYLFFFLIYLSLFLL